MVEDRALGAVDEIQRALRHSRRGRTGHNRHEVRVQVLVQRCAVAEDFAERRDGLVCRSRCDGEDLLAGGESKGPSDIGDMLASELDLGRDPMPG